MAAVSPARKAAFGVLNAIERGHAHANDLLRGKTVDALSPADRNLATALVLGTLRWQINLDHQLKSLLKHPNAKLDAEVLIALRLGAFQLQHLDRIPTHAAIDESVELAKQAGHRFASGMVNAVLRKLAAAPQIHAFEESPADLALSQAHPSWMVERWATVYGLDAARAICHHGQSQPALTVRLESSAVEAELATDDIRVDHGALLTSARTIVSGDLAGSSALREDRVRLQDEGSQLVAELVPRGNAILDCCAAPGGKTLILAGRNPLARIVACESNPERLARLIERLEPLGQRVDCRRADASVLEDDSTYDVVLADVPCSGTGTLGRNPEIRHRLHPEDLPRQADRQKAILRSALRAVRRSGRVLYSTCSLEPEENDQVVAAVLAESPGARLTNLGARIEELSAEGVLTASGALRLQGCITPEGYLRLLPGVLHTDGFFVAMIEKLG
jgi:16S rRNA (cytosine967-C5)-methyltransferase